MDALRSNYSRRASEDQNTQGMDYSEYDLVETILLYLNGADALKMWKPLSGQLARIISICPFHVKNNEVDKLLTPLMK